MTFQEMGEELRKARESRGMSLDEVVEITKISRRNIVALEEGNTDHLPHPVYAKGFVRSYARLLGLDGEELAMVVDQIIPEDEDNLPSGYGDTREADKALAAHESSGGSGKSRLPSILLFIVLLAALVGAVIYFGKLYTVLDKPTASVEEPAKTATMDDSSANKASESDQSASSEEPGASLADETEQPSADIAEAPAASAAGAEQEAVGGADSAATQVDAADARTATDAATEAPARTVEAEVPEDVETVGEETDESQDQFRYAHNIVIRAVTEAGTWVGVWKGDEEKLYRDFILQNGEPLRLKFNSKRRIRIGNAGGVEVTHNGEPMELNAEKGSVKTLVFDVP